ncbi:TrmB family transcriptional regulator [Salinarchaeum laminariae]|uniref:TrmB family transcriptional regulator n=1 Tax=Salinarchaeum laminariae TaxID=869888 RepID=UPI0020C12488|nr:helix-turn-helix domain-containing protein [Salinarchaeum laminariae]
MGTADHDRAVELLKELGMKTYQAECFAALNTIPNGTAREISEVADVPRTRVYDATEALAEQGFVEVQHTNPQRFRAIPLSEAVRNLREQYELRIEKLHETLAELELDASEREADLPEVWTVSSDGSLDSRISESIVAADSEVVLVLGSTDGWTPELAAAIETAVDRGVDVHVVTLPSVTIDFGEYDGVETFQSELPWLESHGEDGQIDRLLLVDRNSLLLTTRDGFNGDGSERAIVAEGASNGAVVLCRRLLMDELADSPLAD